MRWYRRIPRLEDLWRMPCFTPDMVKDALTQFTGALGEIKEYEENKQESASESVTEGE